MKKEIKLADSIGKKLSNVVFSSYGCRQCLLVFDDNTFTTLGIDAGYDEAEITTAELNLYEFGDHILDKHGIATECEIAEMRRAQYNKLRAKIAKEKETRDRKEIERLKIES